MRKIWYVILPIVAMAFLNASCEDDNDPIVDLPTAVEDYINQNYGDYKIDESELDTLCTGAAVYEVELEKKGIRLQEDEVTLVFSTEGGFLFSENEIKVNDLPAEVKTSISTNFAGFEAKEAERLDLANGTKQYEVEIKNGSTTKEVLFAANGTVICEEVESDDDDE